MSLDQAHDLAERHAEAAQQHLLARAAAGVEPDPPARGAVFRARRSSAQVTVVASSPCIVHFRTGANRIDFCGISAFYRDFQPAV